MKNTALAQKAQQFLTEFKAEVQHQVEELNLVNLGKLEDGFSAAYIEDGWVSLKGFSWGFVVLYDEPVRLDMTFGPDWPFIGYRYTFVAQPGPQGVSWVSEQVAGERYHNVRDLARYGLRRLAEKVGDGWVFGGAEERSVVAERDPLYDDTFLSG